MIIIRNERDLCAKHFSFTYMEQIHEDTREATWRCGGQFYCEQCKYFMINERRYSMTDFVYI